MMAQIKTRLLIMTFFILSILFPGYSLQAESGFLLDLNIDVRSYFSNDQRLQWSGAEATFGADAVLHASVKKQMSGFNAIAFGEFRLNQTFDNNILHDEYRDRYIQNFEVDPFQIGQLYVGIQTGKIEIFLGKKKTVFGSDTSVHLTNSETFQPFIRTESILRWETGLFIGLKSGVFRLDVSLVNGGPEKDTNSSKAAVIRAGLMSGNISFGASLKMQDGIGSEWQKQYKNHIGLDISIKSGHFRVSAEGIYDEYGFRKQFDSNDIFWERSFYYRDQFYKNETPITGYGGYIDLCYEKKGILFGINYGEFHPEDIGDPYHDQPAKRTIIKLIIRMSDELSLFFGGLLENDRVREPVFSNAGNYAYSGGLNLRIK
jgi:hypothetical protein